MPDEYEFKVLGISDRVPKADRNKVFIRRDTWDDYHHKTSFEVFSVDEEGKRTEIGSVKIANAGYEAGQGPILVPERFDQLPDNYFSLGQTDDYYKSVARLADPLRRRLLHGLRDMVFDPTIFAMFRDLEVTRSSLMRSVSAATVRGKFARLLKGGAELSSFKLHYAEPEADIDLTFDVEPDASPPTNIHVLIGRNGVGKTRLLSRMAWCMMENQTSGAIFESLEPSGRPSLEGFAGLVTVSFSAFDDFYPPVRWQDISQPRYAYIGLRPWVQASDETSSRRRTLPTTSAADLRSSFADSVKEVLKNKAELWLRALNHLESDPGFAEIDIANLAKTSSHKASQAFASLSSGHKIVLLTITKLVEEMEERTLVLVDEPESHLHPPLLSALVRSLSDLLSHRNGVAIVATHSPVVLQEVPKECVYIVSRHGLVSRVDRPAQETFGENVGTLTHEVFGLEVTSSGFYRLLADASEVSKSYRASLAHFGGQLGGEGRALLRAMLDESDI